LINIQHISQEQDHQSLLGMATFYIVPAGNTIDDSEKEYSIVHFQYSNNNGIKKISTSQIYKQTLFSNIQFPKTLQNYNNRRKSFSREIQRCVFAIKR